LFKGKVLKTISAHSKSTVLIFTGPLENFSSRESLQYLFKGEKEKNTLKGAGLQVYKANL
jgi:hypothetical protein